MDIDDARLLDGLAYDLVLSDAPRGTNRALIANEANGVPPYSDEEVEENQIQVNVNDLSMIRGLHDARGQFINAFLKPGNFFRCQTDAGPKRDREKNSTIVTHEIGKVMKRSIPYFEAFRAKIGLLVLHGIAPSVWETEDRWCTRPLGIGDVLLPSETLLGFENLPFMVLRRQWTGNELQAMTQKTKRDPGWNMDMVEACLDWIDKQTTVLRGNNWPDVWSPERVSERRKSDGGFYANDRAPSIDTFDIYVYDGDSKTTGWKRRIILDTWGTPASTGVGYTMNRNPDKKGITSDGKDYAGKNDFLFSSKSRVVADTWQNIIGFQFADLSAVFPARYHSVRSLGFLLYSVCNLQSRMRCKFSEAVFEALMMQFKVKSMDDVQRALKLDMVNKGFIDDTLMPVPANERWQVRADLVELGLKENSEIIAASTGAFAQRRNFSKDKVEKTRFQVMAEVNADTALISAALQQAYKYQAFEDQEIFRRFCKKNSTDPNVREARAAMIQQGVPEKILSPEHWSVEHEQVMGGGNKTQEMTIAQQLLEMRPMFDPEPQRQVLRDVVLAITDDSAKASQLVPEAPTVSDSVHDSELAFGSLMIGGKVTPKPGLNAVEVAGTIIGLMGQKVQEIMQQGGVGTPADIKGLAACAQYAGAYIQQLSQDKTQKEVVKKLTDALGKIMNEVKGMAQRQQQMMKKMAQQNGQGQGPDPKDMVKAQSMAEQAKIKQDNMKQSHAQRTAQRQIQFEQEMKQREQEHQFELKKNARSAQLDVASTDLKTAAEISRNRLKSLGEETKE